MTINDNSCSGPVSWAPWFGVIPPWHEYQPPPWWYAPNPWWQPQPCYPYPHHYGRSYTTNTTSNWFFDQSPQEQA